MLTILVSCDPYIEDKSDLGPLPNPSFDIIAGATPNDFTLVNTTADGFLTKWELDGNGQAEGNSVDVSFPFMGTYNITMTTFNRGGHATITQPLTVTQDDPDACSGNFELLTGCGEKVWKMAEEAAAMHIGPSLDETWWGNSADDVISRECHFNDRYIFRASGEYEFDNKGDIWADTDGNGNVFPADIGVEEGCHTIDELAPQYQTWGAGVYSFSITESSITVIGDGAWLGLYKVGTAGEVGEPQSSITYSIREISADRMVIFADYGWGVWRFTLVPA